MLLTLLGIGAYTTYKLIDNEDRKARLNNLMKDCDISRDDDFNEFLSIMKVDRQKIMDYDNHSMNEFLFHAVKNLETIPYLTDEDIKLFEQRCWRIKVEHYMEERERVYASASKSMKEYEERFRGNPTHREVYSIRKLFMPNDLEKLKDTYFGKLVYCPEGGRFYSKTQYYTQFVVDVPDGAIIDLIFRTCMSYVQYSEPSAKEMTAIRNAGMYKEIYG